MSAGASADTSAGPSPADAILEGLNDAQRAAVTHGAGPLLIVAGAGTGKTAVLTRRIAWLIATKRVRPEEILALTFTEKAAAEMESRVDLLVPYGFVGATISTFHAFCDGLVRTHAVELGITSKLRVETEAELMVFLREHLFELGLARYLPLHDPDRHLRALLALFDRARDEDVSPERYQAFAEQLSATAADPETLDRAGAEREKALAYAKYIDLLHAHGRVDFGGQIALALRLLRERPYLAREYQERYRHILVDEFQDTNLVQFELVKLLSGSPHHLTVVGDDDQSIYRFRGARVENMLGFLDVFPRAKVIGLTRNYRSGQRILDAAHQLIRHNDPVRFESQRGFDKRLRAARDVESTIEYRTFQTASDEADFVAADVAGALEGGVRAPRGIAVLARTHAHLDLVAAALRARGVPFRRTGLRGLYQRPEVLLCLNVLRTVADPDDGASLHLALGDPLFGADPVDLARLGATARKTHRPLLRLALAATSVPESTLADATREAVRRYAELHRTLCALALRRPTTEVLYAFVTDSGLLGLLAAEDTPEAAAQVQNLNRLFEIATRIGPLLRQDRVPAFIEHLDLLIEMGDDPAASAAEPDENVVQLLTAHNAKGLEFDVVYLVQLAERRFPTQRRGVPLALPPELRHGGADEKAEHDREERRLFYVAMTRARDRLVLAHAHDYGGKRSHKMSRFVAESLGLTEVPRAAAAPSAAEAIARHAPADELPAPLMQPIPDDQLLTLSHNQVDDWLTCGLKYRYAHVAHVPIQTSPVAMYGIAVHDAIAVYLRQRMRGLPTGIEDALAVFDSAWRSEGFFSREHEERRYEQGRETLRRFVAREESGARTPLAVEREFKFRLGANVVRGRLDRVDEDASGIVLVDYKTSEVEEVERAEERTRDSLRDGQLGLYALGYRETFGTMPARVELHFVGAGTVGSARVEPGHLERAGERVIEAAGGIRARRFDPRPAPRVCAFCPYSRFCPSSAARGPE